MKDTGKYLKQVDDIFGLIVLSSGVVLKESTKKNPKIHQNFDNPKELWIREKDGFRKI